MLFWETLYGRGKHRADFATQSILWGGCRDIGIFIPFRQRNRHSGTVGLER